MGKQSPPPKLTDAERLRRIREILDAVERRRPKWLRSQHPGEIEAYEINDDELQSAYDLAKGAR